MSTARGIFAYACFPLTKRRVISGYGNGCSSHHHCGRMLASTAPKPLGETNMAMAEPPAPPFPQKQLDSTSAHAAVNTNYSPRLQQVVVEKGGTTDYEEIEHFEDVDPADWLDERRGAFKALHSFNRVRIPWILAHYGKNLRPAENETPLSGKRILDVGCGAGILSMALCRLGAEVTGIDATENAISIATKTKETLSPQIRSNINFTVSTVEDFAAEEGNFQKFDGIVASEVVEHVTNLPSFIQHCCKLVKPNSPLLFTTINRTILSRLFAKILAEDVLQLLPKGLHDFDKFVPPEELRKCLMDEQCRVGPVLGLIYNPFSNRWGWSSTFTEVNYAMVAFTGQ